jgi:hypothetical protein
MLNLQMTTEDSQLSACCDRVVATGDHCPVIQMFSIVAPSSIVKAMAAIVHREKSSDRISLDSETAVLSKSGFVVHKSKLPRFDAVHAVFVSKTKGIVYGNKELGVGNYLMSSEINSPILPEWIPYIIKKLTELGKIKRLNCHGITAYSCRFNSGTVDGIVSQGIMSSAISIPRKHHAVR